MPDYICNMCEWEGTEEEVAHYSFGDVCPSCGSDNIEELEEEEDRDSDNPENRWGYGPYE